MTTFNFRWLVFILCTLLAACDWIPSWINVTVNFTDAKTVKLEDPVEFNSAVIGKVSGLTPIANGVTIALKLEKSKAAQVQGNAQAAIVANPTQNKIVLTNPPEAGPPVADGGVLVALEPKTGFGAILGVFNDMQKAVKEAAKNANDYFKDANQQWLDSKQKMTDSLTAWQQQAQSTETEVLDRYQKLIQEMESMRGDATEQTKQILSDYDQIEKQLIEKQQALSAQGQAKAAESVQALRDELKNNVDKFK